jgi:hypothetical protein
VSRSWKDAVRVPGRLRPLTLAGAQQVLAGLPNATATVTARADLTVDGTLSSSSGWVLPGNRHTARFAAYLTGTASDWSADSSEFQATVASRQCTGATCVDVPVDDEEYGGLGVAPSAELLAGPAARFSVGMPTPGGGVVTSRATFALPAAVEPVLRESVVLDSAGRRTFYLSLTLLATGATATGTVGGVPAAVVVRHPLTAHLDVDSWATP